jgi:hypothetical protein
MTEDNCPFLSPIELGLTREQRDALIKTLLMMEHGQIHHYNELRERARIGDKIGPQGNIF